MAATDLNDLNNFEYHFETAAAFFLNADLGIDVFRTVIEDTLLAPRLEIQLFVDAAMEPFAPRNGGASSTSQDYRAFTGVFQCRVITDNATGGAAAHATYRSKVRTALMRTATNWTSEAPFISGHGDMTSGTTALTGFDGTPPPGIPLVPTAFTTELAVGDNIQVGGNYNLIVASIESDAALTTTTAASITVTYGNITRRKSETLGPTLPYYDVKKLMPASADYEIDGDMNVTQLMYEITFEIRDDAWPA